MNKIIISIDGVDRDFDNIHDAITHLELYEWKVHHKFFTSINGELMNMISISNRSITEDRKNQLEQNGYVCTYKGKFGSTWELNSNS